MTPEVKGQLEVLDIIARKGLRQAHASPSGMVTRSRAVDQWQHMQDELKWLRGLLLES